MFFTVHVPTVWMLKKICWHIEGAALRLQCHEIFRPYFRESNPPVHVKSKIVLLKDSFSRIYLRN